MIVWRVLVDLDIKTLVVVYNDDNSKIILRKYNTNLSILWNTDLYYRYVKINIKLFLSDFVVSTYKYNSVVTKFHGNY